MSAIPKIEVRTLIRPTYVLELSSLDAFVDANRVALHEWYVALRAHGSEADEFFPEYREFCACQYDRELQLHDRLRREALDEPRYGANTWQDRDADAAGVPLHGEI